MLVGRNPDALAQQFPGQTVASYAGLARVAKGADLLIRLADRNNDQPGDPAVFDTVNVTLPQEIVTAAQAEYVTSALNVSSVQALDERNESAYAVSKRKAGASLAGVEGLETRAFYLPLVHGEGFAGKLGRTSSLPKPLVALQFPVFAAFKSTAHVDRVAAHVLAGAEGGIRRMGKAVTQLTGHCARLLSGVLALTVIVLSWWAPLNVWAVVKWTSPGLGLFVQSRVGREGRLFRLHKFCIMAEGTKQAGTHKVSAAAIKPIGAFLRRTKLDELPQALNIFKGELSLIGPCACLPVQEVLLAERHARGMLAVWPGISGLAQIEGIDMSNPVQLAKRDADYIVLQSIFFDTKIVLATATGRGQGDRLTG